MRGGETARGTIEIGGSGEETFQIIADRDPEKCYFPRRHGETLKAAPVGAPVWAAPAPPRPGRAAGRGRRAGLAPPRCCQTRSREWFPEASRGAPGKAKSHE